MSRKHKYNSSKTTDKWGSINKSIIFAVGYPVLRVRTTTYNCESRFYCIKLTEIDICCHSSLACTAIRACSSGGAGVNRMSVSQLTPGSSFSASRPLTKCLHWQEIDLTGICIIRDYQQGGSKKEIWGNRHSCDTQVVISVCWWSHMGLGTSVSSWWSSPIDKNDILMENAIALQVNVKDPDSTLSMHCVC